MKELSGVTTELEAPDKIAVKGVAVPGGWQPVRTRGDAIAGVLFVAPAVLLLTIFLAVPFAAAVGLSFTNQRLFSPLPTQFIGLANYGQLLTDRSFWSAVENNFAFTLVVPTAQTIFGLALAILINQRLPGSTLFRAMYFAPVVTVLTVASFIWKVMYDPDNGSVNAVLGAILHTPVHVNWLTNPTTALPAIMIMSIWQNVGFQMVMLLAGLQGIPGELYEAARMDGAGAWARFWHVTLPGMRNSLIFVYTASIILSFRLFDQVYVMTGGGPGDATQTLMMKLVSVGFTQNQIAKGSAIGLMYFVLVLLVTILTRFVLRMEGTANESR